MPPPTARLLARIASDFAPAHRADVIGWLTGLRPEAYGHQNVERIQAAMVLAASGDWNQFEAVCRLLRLDWRDVLVSGGLGNADWPQRLDEELGPPRQKDG